MHYLYKNKGIMQLVDNYRDVTIADNTPKIVTKHVRRNLLPTFQSGSLSTQWGSGLNGGETAITHLYVRNLVHIAQASNKSLALLFLDISTAFASLTRHLVFDLDDGDESWP